MKKLIAMISAIAVMGTMSLTSFAEITVASNTEVTGTSLEKGATSGYDASYTSDKVNTQTTIVAVKGTEINTSSIQYINQLTQDSEEVINFDLKDTLNAGETVTVYMGGDAINKTKIGTIAKAAAVQKFTVTFNDGTNTTSAQYEAGQKITTPTAPTKDGYTFDGWKLDGADDATASKDLSNVEVTTDLNYVAVWTANQSGGNEYTLTFLNADGTTFATTTTVSGAVQLPASEPVKAQGTAKLPYAFVGWYTNDALTTKITDATISANTNVYPKFISVSIIGDINGDGKVNATDITNVTNYGNGITTTATTRFGLGEKKENLKYTYMNKNVDYVNGDVNGDGNVNATDITNVTNYGNGITTTATTRFGLGQSATVEKD